MGVTEAGSETRGLRPGASERRGDGRPVSSAPGSPAAPAESRRGHASMPKAETAALSLREQQRVFTRERLIQGALEVFAHKGYVAATIDDIAAAAGASRATFYLHFHSKQDIIAEQGSRMEPEVQHFYSELDDVL